MYRVASQVGSNLFIEVASVMEYDNKLNFYMFCISYENLDNSFTSVLHIPSEKTMLIFAMLSQTIIVYRLPQFWATHIMLG